MIQLMIHDSNLSFKFLCVYTFIPMKSHFGHSRDSLKLKSKSSILLICKKTICFDDVINKTTICKIVIYEESTCCYFSGTLWKKIYVIPISSSNLLKFLEERKFKKNLATIIWFHNPSKVIFSGDGWELAF